MAELPKAAACSKRPCKIFGEGDGTLSQKKVPCFEATWHVGVQVTRAHCRMLVKGECLELWTLKSLIDKAWTFTPFAASSDLSECKYRLDTTVQMKWIANVECSGGLESCRRLNRVQATADRCDGRVVVTTDAGGVVPYYFATDKPHQMALCIRTAVNSFKRKKGIRGTALRRPVTCGSSHHTSADGSSADDTMEDDALRTGEGLKTEEQMEAWFDLFASLPFDLGETARQLFKDDVSAFAFGQMLQLKSDACVRGVVRYAGLVHFAEGKHYGLEIAAEPVSKKHKIVSRSASAAEHSSEDDCLELEESTGECLEEHAASGRLVWSRNDVFHGIAYFKPIEAANFCALIHEKFLTPVTVEAVAVKEDVPAEEVLESEHKSHSALE